MKRPFAVIGFSMLISTLIFYNSSFKTAVVISIVTMAVLCLLLLLRKKLNMETLVVSLASILLFSLLYSVAQNDYYNTLNNLTETTEIRGVVCERVKKSDYAYTYIVKPDNENYKIRYVSESDCGFVEGSIVSGTIELSKDTADITFLESSLASKIYFTSFENNEMILCDTGKKDDWYFTIGKIKEYLNDVCDYYLPGENGAIAKAMAFGNRDELDENTTDYFNYSGTSHLLVVSGLHLSLWAFGLIRIMMKKSSLRKYTVPVGVFCLLFYCLITGFSSSILRAGAMVGAVFISKTVGRGADSVNSIGLAVVGILVVNPFAAHSVSLWFTVLSTLGILVYSDKVSQWIDNTTLGRYFKGNPLFKAFSLTVSVSFSAAVFTLPVFVAKFRILPIATIISNFIMVDVAMVVMVSTVLGTIMHFFGLTIISNFLFSVVGILSSFLTRVAGIIGMAEWSTISIDYDFFNFFIIVMLIAIVFVLIAKHWGKNILKSVSVLLVMLFVLGTLYSISYDYNTPSIDFITAGENPIAIVHCKGESVIVGCEDKKTVNEVKDLLNSHNRKQPDMIFINNYNSNTVSNLIMLYGDLGEIPVIFSGASPKIFKNNAKENISTIKLGNQIEINSIEKTDSVEFLCENSHILLTNTETCEKVFENQKKYDIILIYGENIKDYIDKAETCLKNDDSLLLTLNNSENLSFEFKREKQNVIIERV